MGKMLDLSVEDLLVIEKSLDLHIENMCICYKSFVNGITRDQLELEIENTKKLANRIHRMRIEKERSL